MIESLFSSYRYTEQYLPLHSHLHLTLQRRRERRSSVPHVTFLPVTAKEGGGEGGGGREEDKPPLPLPNSTASSHLPLKADDELPEQPERGGGMGGGGEKEGRSRFLVN